MDYKETLNLPRTSFPMKANLPVKEKEVLRLWEEMNIYEKIIQARRGGEKYVLHDGPPYANGHIHMGHALNKILKDFVIKAKTMEGYLCPFVPGWDCHGLPIEHQVDKGLGGRKDVISKGEKRRLCRQYAEKFVNIQREEFRRLGVFGEWDNPYLTMNFSYEATIVREFGKFVSAGHLYRAKRPVFWCPRCRTALAEAEVEYQEISSPSIYVKFPLKDGERSPIEGLRPSIAIWTTTPWTLPANLALALSPQYPYVAVRLGGELLILAEGRLPHVAHLLERDYEVIKRFPASEVIGLNFRHPFLDRDSIAVEGFHVTLDVGTGVVHIAPGHGQEDYEIGMANGLPALSPVDDRGRFTDDVPFFAGQEVFSANRAIIEKLKEVGALLASGEMVHSYPHCWRCKSPLVLRATSQWFFSLEAQDLRRRALQAIRQVKWIPPWGEERIYGMVAQRPDWCVSRQRAWGVPITVFHCRSCGQILARGDLVEHVASLVEERGCDVWFEEPVENLIPPGTACPSCGGKVFDKEMDILDVWFDSGVSFAATLESRPSLGFPADLYLEGSDQHRGWFHSSLLASMATQGRAPYRAVLTHGFVVDGQGKKMSKSAGNVIAPEEIINRYGAEILRLWVAAEDYREDIKLSEEILTRLTEAYRRIRNTCRFLLGNLYDFDPAQHIVPYEGLMEIDRWILHRLNQLITKVRSSYDQFLFHPVFHSIHNFCVVDLSSLYLDILKDRLYTFSATSQKRRSAQTALFYILEGLVRLMAPILAFTAEEIWQLLPGEGRAESVHLTAFPTPNPEWSDEALSKKWDRLLEVREDVSKALEVARQNKLIGNSLETRIHLYGSGELADFLKDNLEFLPTLFIVSQVELVGDGTPGEEVYIEGRKVAGLKVGVSRARGEKCERCWNYSETVGSFSDHPTICQRCVEVLGDLGKTL
mgnify:CR=1 FL=1